MSPTNITIAVSVLALIIAAFATYKAHKAGVPINGQFLASTLQASEVTAAHYAEIAKAGVMAAEQLKATGKLPDNNAAFQYALNFAKKMLPDLDAATLTTFIEAAVPLANQLYGTIELGTTHIMTPPPPKPIVGLTGLGSPQ